METQKEFAPHEQSLDLKELGFDEPCMFTYTNNLVQYCPHHLSNKNLKPFKENPISAPTFSQAFRWFREKCNLNFTIITNYAKVNSKMIKSYRVGIIVVKNNIIDSYFLRPENDKLSFIEFTTYEEAELECLKELIQIVKTKKS